MEERLGPKEMAADEDEFGVLLDRCLRNQEARACVDCPDMAGEMSLFLAMNTEWENAFDTKLFNVVKSRFFFQITFPI